MKIKKQTINHAIVLLGGMVSGMLAGAFYHFFIIL